jgi:hypothetical protein
MSMRHHRLALLLKAALLLVILADAGGPLVEPIYDPDFFWHLKTGEWIWEHRALPDRFLFVSAPPDSPDVLQRFTTTSYWLVQILYHLVHAAGGLGAIVALRFLLFGLLLLALFVGKDDGDDLVFLGLLAIAIPILRQFPVDRPQFVSFAFFGFLLVLLNGLRAAGSRAALLARAAAIPLLMAVWANCHGGYVVGLGIMALWLLAESLKLLRPELGPLPRERYRVLLAAGVAGALASLLNPNTYHVLEVALQPSWMTSFVQEYRSTVEIYRLFADPWVILYWVLLGLSIAALALSWRRPDLTGIVLIAVTGYFSFIRVRYIPFFLVTALLVCCRHFSAPQYLSKARLVLAAAGLAIGLAFLGDAAKMYRAPSRWAEVNVYQLPVAAADFIKEEGLRGNMFNLYSWGGYLLWRLSPTEAFIDGRNSDRDLYEAYMLIMKGEDAAVHGLPFWKRYFQNRGIRYTVTPFFDGLTGEFLGLQDRLLADPAWVPVYASPMAVVFAEIVPENHAFILRNALSKNAYLPALLEYTARLIKTYPAFVPPYVARGEILVRLGDRAGALAAFEKVLRIAPQQPVALERVTRLRAAQPGGTRP